MSISFARSALSRLGRGAHLSPLRLRAVEPAGKLAMLGYMSWKRDFERSRAAEFSAAAFVLLRAELSTASWAIFA